MPTPILPAMKLDPATDFLQPFSIHIDLESATMRDAPRTVSRRTSEMRGYYKDAAALDALVASGGDPLHYEVFEAPVPTQYGHLTMAISKLQPGLVGEECFMTKGHYHTVPNTAEIYFCLRGAGYMMMKTTGGECAWQRLEPGRAVYVPPYWGHRSINTGAEPLITFCVYPGDAGHNYGDIAATGFPKRVFLRQGREVFE